MISTERIKKASANPLLRERILGMLSEKRRDLIERILAGRTRHVCAVIENLTDSHNTNAVVRSCECFGIQDVHIVSDEGFKAAKRILIGSGKWVDLICYSENSALNTEACLARLRDKGYRIAVTVPAFNGVNRATPLSSVDLTRPLAVCFGHERTGISETLRKHADEFITIPMTGITESLNVSVAAGIIFQNLADKLRTGHINWQLHEEEKNELRLKWALKCVKKPELLLERISMECESPEGQSECLNPSPGHTR